MLKNFNFVIIEQGAPVPGDAKPFTAYLNSDRWDDWGEYCTQFYLTIVNEAGEHKGIGLVKIGEFGLSPHPYSTDLPAKHRMPSIPQPLTKFPENLFSLGQDEDYYENLNQLGDDMREHVLTMSRDLAYDAKLWESAKDERVVLRSLMRSITSSTVVGQFRRMAHGDARLTNYDFSYTPPPVANSKDSPYKLEFAVQPESSVPTNVHVLIGRNGVGKTRLLSLMTKSLIDQESSADTAGTFQLDEDKYGSGKFANLIAVAFSAFDEGAHYSERTGSEDKIGFTKIGIRDWAGPDPLAKIRTKSPDELAEEFVNSLKICQLGPRRRRWLSAIECLDTDPVFSAANLDSLIDAHLTSGKEASEVAALFKGLSSGHKLVLLMLTRLVEEVEEKTLVLIDEPEAHLHPPLMSATIRAVSELLVKTNGVAIVATHSPVILQEVPHRCVWILDKIEDDPTAVRPSLETFGENVGVLTREVFQLELTESGFHHRLKNARKRFGSYDLALQYFGGRIGAEGRAVLRAMYFSTESQSSNE